MDFTRQNGFSHGTRTLLRCTIRAYAQRACKMKSDNTNGVPSSKEALPLGDVGKLVDLLAESGVGEIRVKQGELEITVKARTEALAGTPVEFASASYESSSEPREEAGVETDGTAERSGGLHVMRSPLVGTFYRAPAPGEEPYVEVGDHVGAG